LNDEKMTEQPHYGTGTKMKKDIRSSSAAGSVIPSKHQPKVRAALEQRCALLPFHDEAAPFEDYLFGSATSLYAFFHTNGYKILRAEWTQGTISPPLRAYDGWIYAFYGEEDYPIYVGETGRTFIARFDEHKEKSWWSNWKAVKVLPCPNKAMRKVFESLIGLAGGYQFNKMQPAGDDNLMNDIILSLLSLGNDRNQPQSSPIKRY
jgi:hypothetical protein